MTHGSQQFYFRRRKNLYRCRLPYAVNFFLNSRLWSRPHFVVRFGDPPKVVLGNVRYSKVQPFISLGVTSYLMHSMQCLPQSLFEIMVNDLVVLLETLFWAIAAMVCID